MSNRVTIQPTKFVDFPRKTEDGCYIGQVWYDWEQIRDIVNPTGRPDYIGK